MEGKASPVLIFLVVLALSNPALATMVLTALQDVDWDTGVSAAGLMPIRANPCVSPCSTG